MAILTMLGALALHEIPLVPKLSPAAVEAQWRQCQGEDPNVSMPAELVAACTNVIAYSASDGQRRARAYHWRAIARSQTSDTDAAMRDFDTALAQPSLDVATRATFLLARSQLLQRVGMFEDAEKDLNEADGLVPNNLTIQMGLAKLAIAQRDFTEAQDQLTFLDRAGLDEEDHVQLHALRGLAFEEEGNQTSARADYDKAVEVGPKFVTALRERAGYRRRQGALQGAFAELVAASRLAPRSATAHNELCWFLASEWRREFDRARTACDTATALAPRNVALRDSAGLVALQQKRWPDAWREYDLAVRLNPDMTSARFSRGIAALRLGRTAEGRADIAAAVKADPTMSATYAGYGQTP